MEKKELVRSRFASHLTNYFCPFKWSLVGQSHNQMVIGKLGAERLAFLVCHCRQFLFTLPRKSGNV